MLAVQPDLSRAGNRTCDEAMTPNELLGWRTRRSMSQSALARQLGVSPATVSRWEADKLAMPPWLDAALYAIEHGWQPHTEG